MNQPVTDFEHMRCAECGDPVEWTGRWRHLDYAMHPVLIAEYPRYYYKVGSHA